MRKTWSRPVCSRQARDPLWLRDLEIDRTDLREPEMLVLATDELGERRRVVERHLAGDTPEKVPEGFADCGAWLKSQLD